MRVAFAGTPEFAARALARIVAAGHTVPLVLTQPDRPAGRGLALKPSPVKQLAREYGLAVLQPTSLRTIDAQRPILEAQPEVLVVAAYGLILPQPVLDIPPNGCINIHASLLPRWRGAAPIQRALLAGDAETGITIMQMDAGLDSGPILVSRSLTIQPRETAGSLHDRLAELGAELIVDALRRIATGNVEQHLQPAEGVTYAAKLAKRESELDWRLSAQAVDRRIRAFNPTPGACAYLDAEKLKIWQAEPESGRGGDPGTVLETSRAGILVACGQGALRLTELQRSGGKRLPSREFLAGFPIAPGSRFRLTAG
jgi:methionyl-tRNA formyltransferase